MLAFDLLTPQEIQKQISVQAKEARLRQNISQKDLALRSGVSLGSLKRFETTAEISLQSLLRIALVLGELQAFGTLFPPPPTASLFEKQDTKRQRSRSRSQQ